MISRQAAACLPDAESVDVGVGMRRGIIGICFLLFAARSAQAEDLLALYHAALNADPALRSAQYEEDVAGEKRRQSLASFLPNVTAQFQSVHTRQKVLSSTISYYGVGTTVYPSTNWNATLTQPVFHPESWYAYDQADLGTVRSQLELQVAREDLIVRMVKAYLAALKAEEDHSLAMEEKKTLKSELDVSSVKYTSGLLAVSDLRDVQARYAEVEAQVLSTQADMQDALEKLRGMVGSAVHELKPLREDAKLPEINAMPVDKRVQEALDNNFTVQSKQVAVAIANEDTKRLFAQHYPTADLIAKYGRQDSKGSLFGGGSKIDTADLTLQVDVPLYAGGRVQSQTREAVYKSEQSREELEAARRKVERDIRAGYATLLSSREKIDALQQSLEAKQSLVDLKRQGYKAGLNSILDQLKAQRDYYIAQRDLAAARFDHLNDYVKFKQAEGTLTANDLTAINALLGEGLAASSGSDVPGTTMQLPLLVRSVFHARPEVQPPEHVKPTVVAVTPRAKARKLPATRTGETQPGGHAAGKPVAGAIVADASVHRMVQVAESAAGVAAFAHPPRQSRRAGHPMDMQSVIDALQDWRGAWSARDAGRYFSCYAPDFRPQRGIFAGWKANREKMLRESRFIHVEVNDIRVDMSASGKRARVRFKQQYQSNLFGNTLLKTMQWAWRGKRWLIVSERIDRIIPQALQGH